MRLVRFCLLFCLLSILPAYASVPSAVRTLQSGEVDFESVIRVDVAVSFDDGDLPTAWILEERWSDDCRVLAAFWNGRACAPSRRQGGFSWIFGYPGEGNLVESGTLVYYLKFPKMTDGETRREIRCDGKCHVWDGDGDVTGMETVALDKDAPYLEGSFFQMTLNHGWNLVSLPCTADEESIERLAAGRAVYCGPGTTGAYYQNTIPSTPGEPFWLCETDKSGRQVILTATDPAPEGLVPSGGTWHRGWNLVGVSGMALQNLPEEEHGAWKWEEGAFRLHEGALEPGECAWIYRTHFKKTP